MKGTRVTSNILATAVAVCLSLNAGTAAAQAYTYPSMQLPTVSTRDFTGALSVAKGTVAVFQWREGLSDVMHFSLDGGIGDPEGRNNDLVVFGGGSLGYGLLRATADQPLDVLLAGGAGVALGAGQTVVRLPVGASAGHRFAFEDGMALTPYAHPRISIDRCFSCNASTRNSTEVSLNFDLGLNFEVTPRFALRAAVAFSGSDVVARNDTFAFGINWIPAPLSPKK